VIYVESKNWGSGVGPVEVAWFARKVRERNGDLGVILVRDKISGLRTRDPSGARVQLLMELATGCELIILTKREIERVRSGETLAKVLMKKLEKLKSSRELYEATDEDLKERLRMSIQEAIRQERVGTIEQFLSKLGAEGPQSQSANATSLRQALDRVKQAVADVDDEDPFWTVPRAAILEFGGAVMRAVQSLDEWDGRGAEWIESVARINAPRDSGAFLGSELDVAFAHGVAWVTLL